MSAIQPRQYPTWEHAEARRTAIAKTDWRVLAIASLRREPPRPIHSLGIALQRAAAENA